MAVFRPTLPRSMPDSRVDHCEETTQTQPSPRLESRTKAGGGGDEQQEVKDGLARMSMRVSTSRSGVNNTERTSEFFSLARPKVLFLAAVFAGTQLLQELIAESIFTQYKVAHTYEMAMMYSCFQQMGTVTVALMVMIYSCDFFNDQAKNEQSSHTPPSWLLMSILAILVFASTALPNWAVEFVYFPAKVVAKSTKLVPTMIVSVIMGNSKKFSSLDYVSALLLCGGAVGFALHSVRVDVDEEKGVDDAQENALFGLLLLTIASFADALVPNLQQLVMKSGASAEQVALRVNIVGTTWLSLFLLVSGSLQEWVLKIFVEQHELFLLMSSGAACSGVAVLAYTMLIQEAGSVVAVAVATARKVLTLALSYIVFPGDGKTFGVEHLVSALAVALGMALGPLYERYRKCTSGYSLF